MIWMKPPPHKEYTMYARSLLALALVLLCAAPVAAQQTPPPDADGAPPVPPPVAEFEDERPWDLYRAAFELCATGERERCEQMLRTLSTTYPEHRAGKLAAQTLAGLAERREMPQPPPRLIPVKPEERGASGERYTSLARAELISAQTVHGIVLGVELCVVAECDDARLSVATAMAMGGVGLGTSWYLTRGGVTPGHSVALNSGTVWGAVNAGLLASMFDGGSDTQFTLSMMAGQLAGLGLGQVYYMAAKPMAGQVSLTNSGGIWSLVGFALLDGALDLNLDGDQYTAGMLVAINGGLVAGGLIAHNVPMSRGRALLLDTGGLAGLLTGMGVYVLITNDSGDQGFFTSALLGTGLGLATAAYLTRGWDADDEDVARKRGLTSISLVPGDAIAHVAGQRQGGWGLSASWSW
jgi:hypothetical protein